MLTKPNAGKAEALNFALPHFDEEIYVGIDADTVIAHDAITKLVPHFANPKIGAVAGNAKVGNRVNLWTRWQALEYITSQNFERRALDLFDVVTVVPGAIGAWRTSLVKAGGGYHSNTVAEDADLTMNLLEQGYSVIYEDQRAGLHRGAGDRRWIDAAALPLVVRHPSGHLEAPGRVHQESRDGPVRPAQYAYLPDPAAAGLAADRPDVRRRRASTTSSTSTSTRRPPPPTSLHKLLLFFLAFLMIDFVTSATRVCAGAKASGEQGRRLAPVPYLDSAIHLPAGLLGGAVQDDQARHRRQTLHLGQARPHRQNVGGHR